MTHVPTFVEIQAVLRQIRLHHWKEAAKQTEHHETHMRYVQTLNEFFPMHETAERDSAEADLFD